VSLIDSAKSYLKNDPADWLRFAEELCSEVSAWGSLQLEKYDDPSIQNDLNDLIFPQLLSPQLIRIVAGSKNIEEAKSFIATSLSEALRDTAIESLDEVEGYWDEVVDFSVWEDEGGEIRGLNVTRLSDLEGEYWESDPLVSPMSRRELYVNESELSSLISNVLQRRVTSRTRTSGDIFRLDIIDFALYQALIQHPELIRTLNWRVFEKLLADILQSFGYEVELQQGTKDGGVDLFAIKRADPLGPQRFLLQAKRWSNKVGVEPVRQLAFLHSHYKVTKSCLATTSTFTNGAWELAHQYQWQLELRDFEGIQEWLKLVSKLRGSK